MGPHKSERLPERLRRLLTEAYLANEKVYWQQREQLAQKFANKWVAVHNGKVVAVGEDMATVMDEVGNQGLCDAYIEKVGGESDTVFTIRHRSEIGFTYDSSYTSPIPRIEVKFLNFQQSHQATYTDVIPDTGADNTVLPIGDCTTISIFSSPFYSSFSRGIDSAPTPALIYRCFAEIGGHLSGALIEPHPTFDGRLLGRDVLNTFVMTFDGPRRMTTFQF
jgi:hypothetical protein